eukprot:145167_1
MDTAEMNQLIYNNSNCSGHPISIHSYSQSLHSTNTDFHIFCKGIPCNYGVKRTHPNDPTTNCSDDVFTVSNLSYDEDPYIIGSCQALPTSSFKIDSCYNAEKLNILYYEDSTDCSTISEIVDDPTNVQGYCDEDGTQYDIICGVAETQNINNINCDSTPPQQPSLHGTWSHNGIFGFEIEINSDCTQIIFTLISPQNDTWFAIGMGGEYHLNDENIMNGYAIVQLFSSLDITYETTLNPSETPFPHDNQNIECENKEINGIRTSVCIRAYKTGETDNEHDFYKFIVGGNYILWAYGHVSDRLGVPLKHGLNGIGENHIDVIYLHGERDGLCGYAKEQNPGRGRDLPFSTQSNAMSTDGGIQSNTSHNNKDNDRINSEDGMNVEKNEEWVIIGVVFMILFGITVILLSYFIWNYRCKEKDEEQKYTKTKSEDMDEDFNDTQINIDKQMETATVKDKNRGEMVKVPQHSDLDCD